MTVSLGVSGPLTPWSSKQETSSLFVYWYNQLT